MFSDSSGNFRNKPIKTLTRNEESLKHGCGV